MFLVPKAKVLRHRVPNEFGLEEAHQRAQLHFFKLKYEWAKNGPGALHENKIHLNNQLLFIIYLN